MGSTDFRGGPSSIFKRRNSNRFKGLLVLRTDMQQLQFAAGGRFNSGLHRPVQLFWDIADEGRFGSSEMYNMHIEDDSGVVNIAGVWVGGVQVL